MFKVFRYYPIASFVSILIAAVLLAVFYRQLAIDVIMNFGEKGNLTLAQTALTLVKPQFVDYLSHVSDVDTTSTSIPPVPRTLDQAIHDVMEDTAIVRIKLYNRNGVVVYSTLPSQIGDDKRDNIGFISAMRGQVASKLLYRDSFNAFDKETAEDNLMQTYIPVRRHEAAHVEGAFEIYTDMNDLVNRADHILHEITFGVTAILLFLYGVLVFVVLRAERIVDRQQNTIRERTQSLELLSAQLLTAQENERKRIAGELQEDIAQMLAAIKMGVDEARQLSDKGKPDGITKRLEALLPKIQHAIDEVRDTAMDLRPSSLDDFGVLDSIDWFCRQFQSVYSGISVDTQINLREEDVPGPLKVIIYRIIQQSLRDTVRYTPVDSVKIGLRTVGDGLELWFEECGMPSPTENTDEKQESERAMALTMIKERAVLSGGSFLVEGNSCGGTTFHATWSR